ncbi:ZIP family metal transporter [Vicingaceae bacterium]|nr:ZIP family metal transporter [Vicingaceae bacterium]
MMYLGLFLVSLLSGSLVFVKQLQLKGKIAFLLAFSGAYLLGICLLHLIPELFETGGESVGLYLLTGFFLQLVLDYFSGGIEHGHTHVNPKKKGRFPYLIFLSLGLHAFLESFPLTELNLEMGTSSYLWGLLLHKVPIAIILGSLLLATKLKSAQILVAIILFSLMAPLGALIGSSFSADTTIYKQFLAVSIGIILHLSTTILLETNEEHHVSVKKLVPILLGVVLALLTLVTH